MGMVSGCGEQEAGVASGRGWNLWVWLVGGIYRFSKMQCTVSLFEKLTNRTAGTLPVPSRCGRGVVKARSRCGRGAVEVRSRCGRCAIEARLRHACGMVVVRLRYARGAVEVQS